MTQSGLSRELFESWCTDARNCCIVAGYCVEGTMAKYILSEPEDVPTMSPGSRLPLKMKVSSISFSAHVMPTTNLECYKAGTYNYITSIYIVDS